MRDLRKVLGKTTLSEFFQLDLLIGVGGCVGGALLGALRPDNLLGATGVASQIVGVVVGAVIAGVAVQTAFLDQSFLKKLRLLKREPVEYLSPFIFTAVIGVAALLGIMVLSAMSPEAPRWLLGVMGGATALFSFWSIASILPALNTLVQFIELRDAAVDVPEDTDIDQAGRRPRLASDGKSGSPSA